MLNTAPLDGCEKYVAPIVDPMTHDRMPPMSVKVHLLIGASFAITPRLKGGMKNLLALTMRLHISSLQITSPISSVASHPTANALLSNGLIDGSASMHHVMRAINIIAWIKGGSWQIIRKAMPLYSIMAT
jgi:hypothetical protein